MHQIYQPLNRQLSQPVRFLNQHKHVSTAPRCNTVKWTPTRINLKGNHTGWTQESKLATAEAALRFSSASESSAALEGLVTTPLGGGRSRVSWWVTVGGGLATGPVGEASSSTEAEGRAPSASCLWVVSRS